MKICLVVSVAFLATFLNGLNPAWANPVDPSVLQSVQAISSELVDAFNQKDAGRAAALFVENGELIDEDGTVHQGRTEIQNLLALFFERFPETRMSLETESVRMVGPLAIEDGTRILSVSRGDEPPEVTAAIRYTAVLVKSDEGWRLASVRDFNDVLPITSGEMLRPLEWLVGDWVNEGTDGRVKISYRWSEDKNFILGDFAVQREGEVAARSTQRIGWDPLLSKPRSWLFDSDGGFSQATWTPVEDGWILQSSAVLPDGQTGSANIKITPEDESRFVLSGSDRIVGQFQEDDYEIVVVRRPPMAGKKLGESTEGN
jgi:uncharacterized protein (TIGR02246 family)